MLPVKSREVYVSCYPDNYVMRYCHQSVGVISLSSLNLWHLFHLGYKGTNLQGLTPHHMYCMLISIQRISHSVSKVYSQGMKLKLELKTEEKALTKKETGIIQRLSTFKISAQLIIH